MAATSKLDVPRETCDICESCEVTEEDTKRDRGSGKRVIFHDEKTVNQFEKRGKKKKKKKKKKKNQS